MTGHAVEGEAHAKGRRRALRLLVLLIVAIAVGLLLWYTLFPWIAGQLPENF